MFEWENVTTHVNKCCNLVDELAITSISMNDNDAITNLLGSMLKFYTNITMVQTRNIGTLTNTIKLL